MADIKSYSLNRIKTANRSSGRENGTMVPLWKDYDPLEPITPRFIYYTTCSAGENKGPYLHTKRRTLLNLVEGGIILVYQDDGVFKDIIADAENSPALFDIPAGTGYLIRNPYSLEAKMINICDYPWREGDNETIIPDFSNYKPEF